MQTTTELSNGLNSDINPALELSLDDLDNVNGGNPLYGLVIAYAGVRFATGLLVGLTE